MKNVGSRISVIFALTVMIVSFQNCGKLQPGIAIDDQLLANGLEPSIPGMEIPSINTDELPPHSETPIEIGEEPAEPQMPAPQMEPAPAPTQSSMPTQEEKKDHHDQEVSEHHESEHHDQESSDHEQTAEHHDDKKSEDHDQTQQTADTEDHESDDDTEVDSAVCKSKKAGDHKIVELDATKSSYDGDKDSSKKGTTYIFAKAGVQVSEIKNTQGKTVLCGCKVSKISNNVGSLVMINSYSDKLDGKKGNVKLINSTINSVSNMKGVIKK